MKKFIFAIILSMILVFGSGCSIAKIVSREPQYTVIRIPTTDGTSRTILLPEGSPDMTDKARFPRRWAGRISAYVCAIQSTNEDVSESFGLLYLCHNLRTLVFIHYIGKDPEYYVYREDKPIHVSGWEVVKRFLAEHDPAWKEKLKELDRKKRKREKRCKGGFESYINYNSFNNDYYCGPNGFLL